MATLSEALLGGLHFFRAAPLSSQMVLSLPLCQAGATHLCMVGGPGLSPGPCLGLTLTLEPLLVLCAP